MTAKRRECEVNGLPQSVLRIMQHTYYTYSVHHGDVPVANGYAEFFRYIARNRGRVPVTSGKRTRVVRAPGYPGTRTTRRAIYGYKSGHVHRKTKSKKMEYTVPGMYLVAMIRRFHM